MIPHASIAQSVTRADSLSPLREDVAPSPLLREAVKEAVASGRVERPKEPQMEDHETRRKIIRQWMALPKDRRQTADQAAAFAKRAVEQNKFQRSSREPYDRIMGWLLSRVGRS